MTEKVLRVNRATVFKLRPEPTTMLQPNEQVAIAAGSTYPLHSYAYADINGTFNGHIKFALKDRTISDFNTWFEMVFDISTDREQSGHILIGQTNGQAVQVTLLYPAEMADSYWPAAKAILDSLTFEANLLPINSANR